MRKIPVTVITGFLGAGKTTLVRHLLAHNQGRRIALIVNEFGDIGVDGQLLAACGVAGCTEDDIIELANGCLCCTVADEFLPTMQALLDRPNPPDHIVIETSGLALPKPLVKAFHWPEIRSRVTVDGVVAVVDAPAAAAGRFASTPEEMARPDHDNPLEEVFEDQLACADLILLNKSDLLETGALEALRAGIAARLRPGVKTLATHMSAVDPLVVLGLSAAAEEDLAARPSHHDAEDGHDHDDFESFALHLPMVDDPAMVESRAVAAIAAHDILRLKGFLAVTGKPARHVIQAVGTRVERYFDRPWKADEERVGTLVVIGRTGLDRAAIEAAIKGL
ncbi:CobW GTPase involved in cobalt insertion for B12 biosynthesis [Paramagnetospirillum magnetotacticum MS-1]|uniref:CobW GTPase involved in cobalt insertion for B12 biosynthesis n=1 Tax=Paramagnetospirillum magnetotacticum MS-1 TaxID=272627 RepID=A0A0C2YE44_PARME|nr:cobalamin biosynthesis protein CobW [Paramagnetospirillum magnetotacticum]KIL97974.1 CobW GTPase involved in cobalt insertion for B12 biosynthesis [Paramagnetospirillum magnetotacticum MS-1]